MTEQINDRLQTLQDKVSNINHISTVNIESKSIIDVAKSMYLYIIIIILVILVILVWMKPSFILYKDETNEDKIDKSKLAGASGIAAGVVLGGLYWFLYKRQ